MDKDFWQEEARLLTKRVLALEADLENEKRASAAFYEKWIDAAMEREKLEQQLGGVGPTLWGRWGNRPLAF